MELLCLARVGDAGRKRVEGTNSSKKNSRGGVWLPHSTLAHADHCTVRFQLVFLVRRPSHDSDRSLSVCLSVTHARKAASHAGLLSPPSLAGLLPYRKVVAADGKAPLVLGEAGILRPPVHVTAAFDVHTPVNGCGVQMVSGHVNGDLGVRGDRPGGGGGGGGGAS